MTFDLKKPISDELQNYLREYTTEIDVAEACKITDVGFHTLRRIRLGDTPVSNEKNANAVTELMRIAISNAKDRREKIGKDEKKLVKILDCI